MVALDGLSERTTLGAVVGSSVGESVITGAEAGDLLGRSDGVIVGYKVGPTLGVEVGLADGTAVESVHPNVLTVTSTKASPSCKTRFSLFSST